MNLIRCFKPTLASLFALSCFLVFYSSGAFAQSTGNTIAMPKGLKGEYFAGTNFKRLVLTRTDKNLDFNWTRKNKSWLGEDHEFLSPGPGVPSEFFSVRWTGQIQAPETGTYTIRMTTDDGMRVWLAGVKVLDQWHNQEATDYTVDVLMTAGKLYDLKVEYYQVQYDAVARMLWTLPSQPNAAPQPIPANACFMPVVVKPKPIALDAVDLAPQEEVITTPKSMDVKPKEKSRFVYKVEDQEGIPKLKRGTTLTLPNIYFELNTPYLLPSSEPTLDALVAALNNQPDLRIEIAGHTDFARDKAQSQILSQKRAEVVKDYLVDEGVAPERVSTVGYGCTRPLVKKSDAKNRRVEISVR